VSVSEQALVAWEQGKGDPELEQLETLAEIYRCAVGQFFLAAPERVFREAGHLGPLSFRGLAKEKVSSLHPETRQSLLDFVEMADWCASAIREAGISWNVLLQQETVSAREIDAVAAREAKRLGFSERVRSRWTCPEDAFQWWRSRIEEQGVFCWQMKLVPQDVRGASLWREGIPFILINRYDREAATGRLFTLLHEYFHLLFSLKRTGGMACDFRGLRRSRVEALANRFAAQVLLPVETFQKHLKRRGENKFRENWTDKVLDELAQELFVSKHVLAVALEQLGLAPSGFYQQRLIRWENRYVNWRPGGRDSGGRSFLEQKLRAFGTSTFRLLASLESQGSLDFVEAAYLLDTKVERIQEIVLWARGQRSEHD